MERINRIIIELAIAVANALEEKPFGFYAMKIDMARFPFPRISKRFATTAGEIVNKNKYAEVYIIFTSCLKSLSKHTTILLLLKLSFCLIFQSRQDSYGQIAGALFPSRFHAKLLLLSQP